MKNSVFRKQAIPFTQVPNVLLNSDTLSLKAKGLWAYMNSKPNGWQFSATRIAEEIKEDRKSVLSALKELVSAGFLTANKLADGRMKYTLIWHPKKSVSPTSKPVCSKKEQPKNKRPMKKDFASDEDFEKAFYAWNTNSNVI